MLPRYTTLLFRPLESNQELLQLIAKTQNARHRKSLLVLQQVASGAGHNVATIAQTLKMARRTVQAVVDAYRGGGLAALAPQPRPERPPSRVVKTEALQALALELKDPRSSFTSYEQVRARLEELNDSPVSYHTAYRLVTKELGCKLKVPRPSHVRKNEAREEAVKKNSRC